jgi:hypothetical protein
MYNSTDGRMGVDVDVDVDNMATFIRAPFKSDLQQVPGVGPVTIARLRAAGVTSAYQLLGKFLMLHADADTSRVHCELFWCWLDAIGTPQGDRRTIVTAMAEKAACVIPGIYDPSCFAE